jgi:hypothetical protein
MPPFTLGPYEQRQYLDDDGDPLAFGKVNTYLSGTSTPVFTYADAIGTQNTNPVILSSAGRTRIYLDALVAYKFILTDANDVPVGLTMDPVNAVGSATGAGSGPGEVFAFEGNSSAAITATAYASGAGFNTLHPGQRGSRRHVCHRVHGRDGRRWHADVCHHGPEQRVTGYAAGHGDDYQHDR